MHILENQRIYLGLFEEDDFHKMKDWYRYNQTYPRLLSAEPYRPKTVEQLKKWMTETSEKDYRFSIRLKSTDDLIGYMELDDILWSNRVGWISLGIGELEHRGKGYGKEAMDTILRYAFHELNLHRIQLTVFSYNEPAIHLYEKVGFQKEGTYRQFLERDGNRHDMLLYGLLKEEWRG
ncbi:GNAT family acetyltransferase [Bacillus coahuilensis p1.1.43]|uniref:GNAT family acetyltransferase n=2 Tax=Bacillus coahuilensis TaxID=408580 RepID=A0A147KAI3_9BACI|nr:GNAT family protein [Bacillus coahuilensis]KUP07739.1 GNAT family acetyltransferase [Bacillus coahuilensis p1.1.43]